MGAIYNAELDPLGSNVGLSNPNTGNFAANPSSRWGDPFGGYGCRMDGFETPCSQVMHFLNIGAADLIFAPHEAGFWITNGGEDDTDGDFNTETRDHFVFYNPFGDPPRGVTIIDDMPIGPPLQREENTWDNCMLNLVKLNGKSATVIRRRFDRAHNGRHAVSPIVDANGRFYTTGGNVTAVPVMVGAKIIQWGIGGDYGEEYLDIMLANGQSVRLMDLTSLDKKIKGSLEKGVANYDSKLTVSENQIFGTIGTTNPDNGINGGDGLHVTLIRKGMHADFNSYNRKDFPPGTKDTTPYLLDPLERGSPLRCPEYPIPNNKIKH